VIDRSIKVELHSLCLNYVEQRIETAQKAISIAQASANEETKSSAGDKYETGRAMAQLEIEKNSAQLADALKLKATLSQIKPNQHTATAQLGSIVITSQGNFYLSISAGQLNVNGTEYFAISPVSPIGTRLMGIKKNEQFIFNNKSYQVIDLV
jgi:transcription elongation GreA/GreB family factor